MVSTDDCWLYAQVVSNNGYGSISRQRVHRVMYEEIVGPIPEGLEIDHLCRIRCCVNPDHLEPVTHAENMRRVLKFPSKQKGHCIRGHELTPDNLYMWSNGTYTFRKCKECIKKRYIQRKLLAASPPQPAPDQHQTKREE